MSGTKCRTSPPQTSTGRIRPFERLAPKSLEEAVAAMRDAQGRAVPFAGGTDLVPMMKLGVVHPQPLVSLTAIPGLKFLRQDADGLHIGPLTTIAALRSSELLRENWPAVHEAVRHFAAPQVRNMATLGGNIGRRSPCANTPPPLIALSAMLTLVGPRGRRCIPLEEYCDRPHEAAGELITEVTIPPPPAHSSSSFIELTRNTSDLAKVNSAVNVSVRDGVCTALRVVLGSVANRPVRISS